MQCLYSHKTKLWKSQGCAVVNLYYEVNDSLVNRKLYKSKYYVVDTEVKDYPRLSLQMDSDRIWCEDITGVRFVKNRYIVDYNDVDLKEFMWIKLKAQDIR